MEWQDHAIVLAVRRHGETGVIASLLTPDQGRHMGLVRGGVGRQLAPVLQPGNRVHVTWRARLEDHLGTFTVEPTDLVTNRYLGERRALAAIASATALAHASLPERERHAPVYEGLGVFLDALGDDAIWPAVYVRWELGLLQELGFGLDLSKCAATGAREDLVYVSPRTGRAVSREAGAPYAEKLLPLPAFLLGSQAGWPTPEAVLEALDLAGFFLERRVFLPADRALPEARGRLIQEFVRGTESPVATPAIFTDEA